MFDGGRTTAARILDGPTEIGLLQDALDCTTATRSRVDLVNSVAEGHSFMYEITYCRLERLKDSLLAMFRSILYHCASTSFCLLQSPRNAIK
jgi:hypothetical protein